MNRRKFLKWTARLAAIPAAGVLYGFWEASAVHVVEQTIPIAGLPKSFEGKRIALLSDLHLGPYNSLDFIQKVVRKTQKLHADMIALAGDFVHVGTKEIDPCLNALSQLYAPLGVYAVPGNHDMTQSGKPLRRAITKYGIRDLTNSSQWIESGSDRLLVGGVDDLWYGQPDLDRAIQPATPEDVVVLLSHNPDFAEKLNDARVKLVLSGHTHGGQIYLPIIGSPWTPSRYGKKYLKGLVQAPQTQVFVSGGVGCVGVPMRFGSRPEINLLTLTSSQV
jgi:uncharacterized protein